MALPGSLTIYRKKQVQGGIEMMKLYVNGVLSGTLSPGEALTVKGLDAGVHDVRIEHGPKTSLEERVEVRGGQITSAAVYTSWRGLALDIH